MATVFVTISPEVIRTVVRNTALSTEGVMALVEPEREGRAFGVRQSLRGVDVQMVNDQAVVALRVVAVTHVPLHILSQQLRQSIAEVVEEITGIQVASVDVSIEDVRQ